MEDKKKKTIDDKFEVIRKERNHRENCLHAEIKFMYNYYISKGVPKEMAVRYAKWNYENIILPSLEEKKKNDK